MPAPFHPPVAVPSGQTVVWALATTHASSSGFGCSATATNTTGTNVQQFSAPLSGSFSTNTWSNFVAPSSLTRPGTVIHAIYPTLIGNGSCSNSTFQLFLNGVPVSGAPWNGAGSGAFNSQWFNSAGTNPAVIAAMTIQAHTEATLPIGVINDVLNSTFLGVAIYIDAVPPPTVFVNVANNTSKNVGFN